MLETSSVAMAMARQQCRAEVCYFVPHFVPVIIFSPLFSCKVEVVVGMGMGIEKYIGWCWECSITFTILFFTN